MNQAVIQVEQLSKRYTLGQTHGLDHTLSDMVGRWMQGGRSWWRSTSKPTATATAVTPEKTEHWALRDISFEIKAGEAVGIIGTNGAGKSTLLKILSQITDPSHGQAMVQGRVASLLEVGTGFHPELTGRENIFLNGSILGMSRKEIQRSFDDIVEFAQIRDFLDTPVKRYSSGMYVRLAFAVAAHLDPQILLVDEVLAVGDSGFQQRCLGRMSEVAKSGRTVLFVSHNLAAVRSLCQRCLLLDQGRLVADGDPAQLIEQYRELTMKHARVTHDQSELIWHDLDTAPGQGPFRLTSLCLKDEHHVQRSRFNARQSVYVELGYTLLKPVRGMKLYMQLHTEDGVVVLTTCDHQQSLPMHEPGEYRSIVELPGKLLNNGRYMISVAAIVPGMTTVLPPLECLHLTITDAVGAVNDHRQHWPGVIAPELNWRVEETQARSMAA